MSNTIVKLEKKIFNPNLIPDVTGIGAKDAVFLLEKTGMKVNVVGKGKVISQSVTPGTKVIKGNEITLILSRKEI
jgi:cell division protein FtsI (penicillin-binding protein 3)